jgi:Flp pilus assembly protein TadD
MLDWVLAATLALAAPSPESGAQVTGTRIVSRAPAFSTTVAEPDDILRVPDELRARLHAEVIDPQATRTQRFQRLVDFMFEPSGLGMTYQDEPTPTVSEAYATRKANCLGFTLLFLALAREADVDAWPQEIRETLSWRQQDQTIFRSSHVNAGVRIGPRTFTVDVARDAVIARYEPQPMSEKRLLAHYHNNLSIEALSRGDVATAQRHMQRVLALDPFNPGHWTNAGVLHVRRGDIAAAERDYRRALSINSTEAGALFNLVSLSQRKGDAAGEAEFRRRLERVQKKDPFYHFLLATDYERKGDYANAIDHYQRAIHWHRDEHRFFAALARVYLLSGDTERAGKALQRAQALTKGRLSDAYGAKLDRLR